MLYIHPVIYDIYALTGTKGQIDPVDALRAGPQRGDLIIRKRFANSTDTSLTAELFQPGSTVELLTGIERVRLVAMDSKGMVLEGVQTIYVRDTAKAKKSHIVQRWLCKLPGTPAVLNTEKLIKRSAARLNAAMVSGFDPSDDDRIS